MSACKSCERPIRWVKLAASGKKMPLDPRPRADGNLRLLASSDPDGTPLAAFLVPEDLPFSGERFVSHFATCPHAASHRTAS